MALILSRWFRSPFLRVLLAVGCLGAAGFAAFFAGVIDWLACENDTSEACGRRELASLQLGVALGGLGPTLILGVALVSAWRRTAAAMFVLSAATYVAWALLADAAVHGWDDLKFFPS